MAQQVKVAPSPEYITSLPVEGGTQPTALMAEQMQPLPAAAPVPTAPVLPAPAAGAPTVQETTDMPPIATGAPTGGTNIAGGAFTGGVTSY